MYGKDEIFQYCGKMFSAEPVRPWKKYPEYAVIKHPGDGKWFAVVMTIPYSKLDKNTEGNVDIINLKIKPSEGNELRASEGIYPAWHMNKKLWVSVVLNGTVPDIKIEKMIDDSFILTLSDRELRSLKEKM